jgi:hypothetical protein
LLHADLAPGLAMAEMSVAGSSRNSGVLRRRREQSWCFEVRVAATVIQQQLRRSLPRESRVQ